MKRSLLLIVATALLTSCATTPAVFTDFDPGASFGQYRTYRWTQKPEGFSPLAEQRLIAAVDAKLRERGWTQSTNPQVNLVGSIATETRYRMDTWGPSPMWGWGGWGWHGGCCWGGPGWGWGGSFNTTTTMRSYTHGTLVLDMFDAQTQRPIWRGIAMGTVPDSPIAQTNAMQASIDRMFAQFPPTAVAQIP
ncbi:MAG TPA: DUF4136 domain-containing protein [Lysobacter sp.]